MGKTTWLNEEKLWNMLVLDIEKKLWPNDPDVAFTLAAKLLVPLSTTTGGYGRFKYCLHKRALYL